MWWLPSWNPLLPSSPARQPSSGLGPEPELYHCLCLRPGHHVGAGCQNGAGPREEDASQDSMPLPADIFPQPDLTDDGLARPVLAGIVATICFLAAAILFSTLAACFVNKQRKRKLKRKKGGCGPHPRLYLALVQKLPVRRDGLCLVGPLEKRVELPVGLDLRGGERTQGQWESLEKANAWGWGRAPSWLSPGPCRCWRVFWCLGLSRSPPLSFQTLRSPSRTAGRAWSPRKCPGLAPGDMLLVVCGWTVRVDGQGVTGRSASLSPSRLFYAGYRGLIALFPGEGAFV